MMHLDPTVKTNSWLRPYILASTLPAYLVRMTTAIRVGLLGLEESNRQQELNDHLRQDTRLDSIELVDGPLGAVCYGTHHPLSQAIRMEMMRRL